jgi:hypothetical protein
MVTLVVLSAGIVFIYKTFFLCVDYMSRLSMRMQASELIDQRIADITRTFGVAGNRSLDQGPAVVTRRTINRKPVEFHYQAQAIPVSGFEGLFELEVSVSWVDQGKPAQFTRWAALSL